MNARNVTSFGVVLLLAFGLAACGGSGEDGPVEEIRLAVYEGSESALVYIAEKEGFFAQNRINVTFNEFESGKAAGDAVIAGDADIATSADFVFVSSSLDGHDLRILATIAEMQAVELVARSDRGISDPADLRDKTVGVTRKSVGEFYLGTFLTFAGLALNDVTIVDLSPSEIVEAISQGDIDAGLTWNPNAFNIKQALGENAIAWPGQSDRLFYFVLIAQEDVVSERPEAITRFLKAVEQAEDFTSANDEAAKQFIRQTFSYDESYIDAVWPSHSFVVSLPQAMLVVFEDQATWRIENGLADAIGVPNFLEYIYFDGLEAVNPAAITVIR